MKKKLRIKNKLINHITRNGNKKTSEKILLKSFKKLQKDSLKQSKKILQLALINSTAVFKLNTYKLKKKKKSNLKEIPTFISNTDTRTSLAIKHILNKKTKDKNINKFFLEFKKEILLTSQQKGSIIESKTNIQKQIPQKKRFFAFYKWK
jgi:ribosomal protein S7